MSTPAPSSHRHLHPEPFLVRACRATRHPTGLYPPLAALGVARSVWLAVVWALVAVHLLLLWWTPWAYVLYFVVFPLIWWVYTRYWAAVLALVAIAAGAAAVGCLAGHEGWWEVPLLAVVLSLVSGTWVTWVQKARYDAVVALADREASLAALARAQDELASAEHAAGAAAERERWAREVHDTLAQGFVSVITLTQAALAEDAEGECAGGAGAGPRTRDRLEQIEQVARENLAEARALVEGREPSSLRERGLRGALRRLADSVADNGLEVSLTDALPGDLSPALQVVVLRVVQEALSNVVRHSGASRVEVRVEVEERSDGRELAITVSDDGVGMGGARPGVGLTGMRTRAELLGGGVTVEPLVSQGSAGAGADDGAGRVGGAGGRAGTVVRARMPL